jgi:hypothetical protein
VVTVGVGVEVVPLIKQSKLALKSKVSQVEL